MDCGWLQCTLRASQWTDVWRFKGLIRHSLLLWFVRYDCLPTKQLLRCQGICSEDICSLCGVVMESTLYVLRDCRWPQELWLLLFNLVHFASFLQLESGQTWVDCNLH